MQTLIKAIISVIIILIATEIGKRIPSAAGLIGVMPLTGALVLVWIYLENGGNVFSSFIIFSKLSFFVI